MKSIKLNKGIVYNLIIIALIAYISVLKQKQEEEVVVPAKENTFITENPTEKTRFDSVVYIDSIQEVEVVKIVPVENPVNKDLLAEYEEAVKQNDSLKQALLYKDAITERIYEEKFEDSVQVITVETEVVGTLKSQLVSYKTKPKIINIQTEKQRASLYAGGFVYGFQEVAVGLNLNLVNKEKNRIFTFGYDTQKRVHFGVTLKLY